MSNWVYRRPADYRGKALQVILHPIAASGAISATLPIVLAVTADLRAGGKLDATLPMVFGITASLVDATPPVGDAPIYIRRLKGMIY